MQINSPLEQFKIYPLLSIYVADLDFSITNSALILFVITSLSFLFFFSLKNGGGKNSFHIIPQNNWQVFSEFLYTTIVSIMSENIKDRQGEKYLPLVFSIFVFIFSLNIAGLVPYGFTLTSHFIVTFYLSFSIFIGINIIGILTHGSRMFCLFLPSGTSIFLAFLVVHIELISYLFKPVSLSIRLTANIMAGHVLLKIILAFTYSLIGSGGFFFFLHYIPLLVVFPLLSLEFAVALIQAYVYTLLICVYINDCITLH